MRLRSDLLVATLRARAEQAGCFATVLAKGHESGGIVHVLLIKAEGVSIFVEQSGDDPWRCVKEGLSQDEAHAHIDRERDFDPDLWALEIDGDIPIDRLLP